MPPAKTPLGSPASPRWDQDWFNTVVQTERKLGHRICGARTNAGTPCTLKPNHPNGRCKFHGGFDLTGAQPGNRNAVTHGLYARALRTCGPQCPLWNQCPCAGDDVAKLPPAERPTCPYEATEFQMALTDIAARARITPTSDPVTRRMLHQAALLQVMTTRAAIALRDAPITIDAGAKSDNYQYLSQKPNPLLDAYFRIAREYRQAIKWLDENSPIKITDDALKDHQRRAQNDASLAPEDQARLDTTPNPAEHRARHIMQDAIAASTLCGGAKTANRLRDQAKALIPDAPAIWDIQLPHERQLQPPDTG